MSMAELIRMDEYCSSVRDGTHDTPKPTESGYYLVTSKAINNNNAIDLSACYFISESDYNKINVRSKVDKWDVIMTMIGTVGRLHLVQIDPEYAIKNIALFKVGDEDRAKWLYYYLSTSTVQNYFELVASGTSQHFIGLGHLRKFKVENYRQDSKRITDILSAYDNLIEVNNKRIKVLGQMAENLYKEWFVRFRFPGHEKAEFVNDSPRGWTLASAIKPRCPKGWHYGCFSELGLFVRGKNITSAEMENGDIPVISAGLEPSGYHNDSNVKGKSLTISASGANAGYLKYNLDDIWAADCSYYQNGENIWFAYCSLKHLQPVISNLQCGAAQPHVHPKHINRVSVIIPPNDVIKAFCETITPFFEDINKLTKENNVLIQQRDLLLPRLMSGKLEV